MKRIVLAVPVAALLAGCGGGASGVVPHSTATATHTATVAFVMHWPAKQVTVSTRRGPKFISPSTASIVVEVNPGASTPGPVTFANPPASGATTSTVDIQAPAGQDTFVFTLYDQKQTAGESIPAGNPLGEAQQSVNIQAGKSNTVNATISGLVGKVTIGPAQNQPLIETTSSGFALVGDSPQIFTVTAEDIDGNVIVPQPTVALAAPPAQNGTPQGGSSYFNVAPVSNQPNEFAVNVLSQVASGIQTTLTASAQGSNGDQAQTNIPVQILSAIYVGYANATNGAAPIALFDGNGKAIALPSGAFPGVINPAGLSYDPVDHRVLVADPSGGTILAFDPLGNPIRSFNPVPPPTVTSVLYDTNNSVTWALGMNGNVTAVNAFNASGTPINLQTNFFFNTDHGSAIGLLTWPGVPNWVGGDTRIALGSSTSGNVDIYDETATYQQTATTSLSATNAVTGFPNLSDSMLVSGTPGTAGGPNILLQFFWSSTPTASTTVPDARALAYDLNSSKLLVASGATNQIVPVTVDAFGSPPALTPAAPIVTAAPSGLSTPQSIAISF